MHFGAGSLEIEPISPVIGAVVHGVNLSSNLSGECIDALYSALLRYKVIFFRDQVLDAAAQVRFAQRFGTVDGQPGPANRVSNPVLKLEAARDVHPHTWHTDTSWSGVPPMGAVLRAVDVPLIGGDTIWADGVAAFDNLPRDLKRTMVELNVFHDNQVDLVRKGIVYPTVLHPLVRTHPDTGRPALWPSYNVDMRVQGLSAADGQRLLRDVYDEITRPEHQVRFRWSVGAVAFWDNRCTLHYAVKDYGPYPRHMERVLVNRGEVPFFDKCSVCV